MYIIYGHGFPELVTLLVCDPLFYKENKKCENFRYVVYYLHMGCVTKLSLPMHQAQMHSISCYRGINLNSTTTKFMSISWHQYIGYYSLHILNAYQRSTFKQLIQLVTSMQMKMVLILASLPPRSME